MNRLIIIIVILTRALSPRISFDNFADKDLNICSQDEILLKQETNKQTNINQLHFDSGRYCAFRSQSLPLSLSVVV